MFLGPGIKPHREMVLTPKHQFGRYFEVAKLRKENYSGHHLIGAGVIYRTAFIIFRTFVIYRTHVIWAHFTTIGLAPRRDRSSPAAVPLMYWLDLTRYDQN